MIYETPKLLSKIILIGICIKNIKNIFKKFHYFFKNNFFYIINKILSYYIMIKTLEKI